MLRANQMEMVSELAAKRLELLKRVVPRISRVLVLAYLVDPIAPLQVKALKEAIFLDTFRSRTIS
jgi:hypothetical protein